MTAFVPFLPYLLAMAALAASSGFFSCSEAALFYLGRDDREQMARGGPGERAAAGLLEDPERLLTSILFWNLVINMAYFVISSLVTVKLTGAGAASEATALTFGSLLAVIVFSEMLPKNLGVLLSRPLAGLLGLPLAVATRVLDPVLPTLQTLSNACERLVAPKFESEAYMELADLERAITLSGSDQALIAQERNLLSRVVALSELRAEEVMRPRRHYLSFTPPVTLTDLPAERTPSGYLLITEPDSEEIAAALPVDKAALLPATRRLDHYAQPVLLTPWCASAGVLLDKLRTRGHRVAAVINELGETIGIVTIDDLLGHVLLPEPATRHPQDKPGRMTLQEDGGWRVAGRTTLRRVAKQLATPLPPIRSITVTGMLQEELQRVPELGDALAWGGLRWEVIEADDHSLEVKISPAPDRHGQPPAPSP